MKKKITYKESGVDIEKGDLFVEKIKKMVGATHNAQVLGGIGGFAGLYDLGNGKLLATGTDGVGTKLMLAQALNKHDTIGQDLVAMCVNDIVCTGARPLFFLDYLASGKLDVEVSVDIVKGISDGCLEAQAALIGGETAEMPGMYGEGEYDLAGFAVGEVSREELIDGQGLQEGDTLIGLASSGFHSNGYSLVRKLIEPQEEELMLGALTPTRIYVKTVLELKKVLGPALKGLAHITGSGFLNIPRINGEFDYLIDNVPESSELPQALATVVSRLDTSPEELYSTFNMGIGMVVATSQPEQAMKTLQVQGERFWVMGKVTRGSGKVLVQAGPQSFELS